MKNIGIIGCGKIAQIRHIPEYAHHPDANLCAFYDINEERAKALAERYGGKVYSSIDALLKDENLDAVSVCVPNEFHAEVAIKAMEAGKDVLCEKPMAVTLASCREMIETAAKTGRKLMIGQNQRLAKAHQKAKELLLSGMIGNVLSFRTTFGHGGPETWSIDPGKNTWFFDKNKAIMGAMADLGIHKTDLIQYLLSDEIDEVTAKLMTLDKRGGNGELIGVDDNAICVYHLRKGTIGTMTASWTYYGKEDNSTILYGTEGIMYLYDDPKYGIKVVLKNGEEIFYRVDQIQTNDNQTESGVIACFMDCLEHDKEPEISAVSVYPAMRAVFAAIESQETGKTVKLN